MRSLPSLSLAILLGLAIAASGRAGFAQTGESAAKQPVSGTRLITLGTAGGPLPRASRAQSSNLLIVNGALYLVDAGDGVLRRLVEAGANFKEVGEIFITHNHSDHMAGLATLMAISWEYQRRKPINVYGPPGTAAVVQGAIAYFAPNAEIRWAEGKRTPLAEIFVGHDVAAGAIYEDANVKVTAIENTHFHLPPGSPPYGKHKSYAYRFETPNRVVVFTGDTGPSDAVTALAKGADLLVSEVGSVDDVKQAMIRAGMWQTKTPDEQAAFIKHLTDEHLTPEDVGKMATQAGVKTVVLTHLSPTGDDNDDYARYADETRKFFSGQVLVAKDLMEF